MARKLPIQVLLGGLLAAMAATLLLLFALMQRQGDLRGAFERLNEQRLGVSRVLYAVEDRADQLQRLARLAAATGEADYLREHAALRRTLDEFRRASSRAAADALAGRPVSGANAEFRRDLAAAELSAEERQALATLLGSVVDWAAAQATLLDTLPPGRADATLLQRLAAPEQELVNWRTTAVVEELEHAAQQRLDAAGRAYLSELDRLRGLQQLALGVFALWMVIGLAAFQWLTVRPLKQVLAAATRIGGGQYHVRTEPAGVQEIQQLAQAVNWMAAGFEADIRARLDAEERARQMEARVREVGDLAPGAIWAARYQVGEEPQVIYLSRGFNDLYALGAEAVRRDYRNLFRSIHESDRAAAMEAMERSARHGSDLDFEHRSLRPDGSYRWTRALARLSRSTDGAMLWNGFSMDIHELKRLRESTEDALSHAQSASEAKSAFLANISHEVRTPLNAIIGIADLALAEEHPRPLQKKFSRIHQAGSNLLRLLNDVLDTSKLEAGRMALHEETFSLRALLQGVYDLHRDSARNRGLELRLQRASDAPDVLRGDPMRLQQVLGNLLSNALKFTESGQVTLSAARSPTPGDERHVWLRLGVSDTGPGIPAASIPELFEAFTQHDPSIRRSHGGTGLGLTIVRQIVELMGGEIRVDSTPGTGSAFWLELPFVAGRESELPTLPELPVISDADGEEAASAATRPAAPLQGPRYSELLALTEAGDVRARELLPQWYGEALPGPLGAVQNDLEGFDFEAAARRLRRYREEAR